MTNGRPIVFATVAAAGFLLQTATVRLLTQWTATPAELATAAGVEFAVLHNFLWHERWTWSDRPTRSHLRRFVGYQIATGFTSILGNVLIVSLAVHVFGIGPTVANVLAVALMSVANYLIADRLVFRTARGRRGAGTVFAS